MPNRSFLAWLTAAMIAAPLPAQQAPAPSPPPAREGPGISADDIVVTAKPGPPRQRLTTIGYFRQYCFDAMRHTRKAALPENDLDWDETDPKLRALLKITDPDVPSFALDVDGDGRQLIVTATTVKGAYDLPEKRCTMIIVGGGDHKKLVDQISSMFRGGGTQRHVGENDGVKKLTDWDQWLWASGPDRRSEAWQAIGNTWLIVTSPHYYDSHDYAFVDLKIKKTTGRPISIVTLGYIHAP